MALGGHSDRSGNNLNMFSANASALLDGGEVIFSDEGSNDSLTRDETANVEEEVWKIPESQNKASLKFMRAMTQKMQKGDETDQAIQKVLSNLVQNVLVDFDPNA